MKWISKVSRIYFSSFQSLCTRSVLELTSLAVCVMYLSGSRSTKQRRGRLKNFLLRQNLTGKFVVVQPEFLEHLEVPKTFRDLTCRARRTRMHG